MLGAIAPGIEQPSAVIIAKARRRSSLAENAQNFQHPDQRLIELRGNRDPISFGKDSRVKEKVQRVDVIVDGLFEVEAVSSHLTLRFLDHGLPAAGAPARCPA